MAADTSKMAAQVAAVASGVANPYWLLWVAGATAATAVKSPTYKGFALQGTDQGHPYQGMRVGYSTGATLTDIAIRGIVGGTKSPTTPPDEVHHLYPFHADGLHSINCLLDGRDASGKVVGATLLGHWDVNSVTHDGLRSLYSNGFGAAHSGGTYGHIVYNKPELGWCAKGFNFEKMDANAQGCVIDIYDANVHDLGVPFWAQISTANLKASCVVNFHFDTIPVPAGGVTVKLYGPDANGKTNGQKLADVHVLKNGADVTATELHTAA
jgi:hypothetical protein